MTLDELADLRRKAGEADQAFRSAVVQAHAEGHSLRAIGNAVGMSHEAIAKIVRAAKRQQG